MRLGERVRRGQGIARGSGSRSHRAISRSHSQTHVVNNDFIVGMCIDVDLLGGRGEGWIYMYIYATNCSVNEMFICVYACTRVRRGRERGGGGREEGLQDETSRCIGGLSVHKQLAAKDSTCMY